MKIIDNISEILKDDLEKEIKKKSKLSIASACFSMYAFEKLKEQLTSIDELRFLFTSPTFITDKQSKEKKEFYIPKMNREKNLYGTEFEIKLKNELTQKSIARECAQWIKEKVKFKSNITEKSIPNFTIVDNDTEIMTYTPINEFTTIGLGVEKGNNLISIINKIENYSDSKNYLDIFNRLWNNDKQTQDVTDEIIRSITTIYNENTPEFIYYFTIYNIFHEFLDDINQDYLPNEKTGFKDSQIWNKLYNFQRDGCLAIINKLEKYDACILADSVGLGKTFTALSVIKYYEGRNKNVLVLCPKKLAQNWDTYKSNYINNPISKDKLRYDVLFHTDLSRKHGESNGIDLSRINWSNYDLVVIDESHNFRNGGKRYIKNDVIIENRFNFLKNEVIKKGVETKLLMLTATPINNRFNDLKHQLSLAYNNAFEKEDGGKNINFIFREAQQAFNNWEKIDNLKEKTPEKLLSMLSYDFIDLLDKVTIARSRKHIEKYYDMADIGTFPKRNDPKNVSPQLVLNYKSSDNENNIYKSLYEILLKLSLSVYAPSKYILEDKQEYYENKYGNKGKTGKGYITQATRERGITKLMVINMLKRLESSIYSFNLTVESMLKQIKRAIKNIEDYENTKNDKLGISIRINKKEELYDEYDEDEDGEGFDMLYNEETGGQPQGDNGLILFKDIDYISCKRDLEEDKKILETIYDITTKNIPVEKDNKFQELLNIIDDKIQHPINGNNKKIIIFTAFADTAKYLYNNLSPIVKNKYGIETSMVTGERNNCTVKNFKNDTNNILTAFSPISKERNLVGDSNGPDIDLLIATDCISEGQNLQDCDFLINYDIHWNPIRIIQRFGRIDRIGSKNEKIQLVNFWPPIELNEYIRLRSRVEDRMVVVFSTSGGGQNPIDNNSMELEYRKKQLEDLQKKTLDIEDMNQGGASIMDLGLNEFRLDLVEYSKNNKNIDKNPFGMNAVIKSTPDMPAGVIYILKNINENIKINNSNRLHPFYMIYVRESGEIEIDYLHPKKLLDKMRLMCKNKPIDEEICDKFNKRTNNGKDMVEYSNLLKSAINSLMQIKQEKDIDSLFTLDKTTALENDFSGLDDFQLVSFLIIQD